MRRGGNTDTIARSRTDKFGRYYSREALGRLLVEQMSMCRPAKVLDLGVGEGALSTAAADRWPDIELLTVDIDRRVGEWLAKHVGSIGRIRHGHLRADALSPMAAKWVRARLGKVDAAVCNPPFLAPKWRKGFGEILEDAGFSGCIPVLSDVDAATLFLAQNLRLIGERGTLGIILPDSLISAAKHRSFRQALLSQYKVHSATRLPRSSFHRTDALAHILIIEKGEGPTQTVDMRYLVAGHGLSTSVHVDASLAADRLDINYHRATAARQCETPTSVPLRAFVTRLARGSFSSAERAHSAAPIFHTTEMTLPRNGRWCDLTEFGSMTAVNQRGEIARPGDILIARVGRKLEEKVLGVAAGSTLISDSVYCLRVRPELRETTLKQLCSSWGRTWLADRAYGVGARQLTKADLLEFPISSNY